MASNFGHKAKVLIAGCNGSTAFWLIINTAIVFVVSAWLLDFTPAGLEIKALNQTADATEPLDKLDRYIASKKPALGKEILMLGSSLGLCAANMADYKNFGEPDPENVSFRDYFYFRTLDKLLNKERQKKPWRTINLSHRGNMVSEDLVLLKAAFQAGIKPEMVLYLCSPRDFIDNLHSEYGRSVLNRTIELRSRPDWVLSQSADDNLSFLAYKYLPVYSVRRKITDYLSLAANQGITQFLCWPRAKEIKALTAPPYKAIKDMPAGPSPAMLDDYKKRYLPVNWRRFNQESGSLKEMSELCRHLKIPLLVVAMPLTKANLQILPAEFLANYELVLHNNGPHFIDLSSDNLFQADDFLDDVHLRSSGGIKLAKRLGVEITKELY